MRRSRGCRVRQAEARRGPIETPTRVPTTSPLWPAPRGFHRRSNAVTQVNDAAAEAPLVQQVKLRTDAAR